MRVKKSAAPPPGPSGMAGSRGVRTGSEGLGAGNDTVIDDPDGAGEHSFHESGARPEAERRARR